MRTKKKRLLFGAVDIGYRINHYSEFIKTEFGDELIAESFSKYKLPESHYDTSYTYTCEIEKKSTLFVYCYTTLFFIRALFRYQIFHFFSGETILPWKLRGFELACYKLLGKNIIMHFVGSDIRNEDYLNEKNDYLEDYLKGEYQLKTPVSSPIQEKLIRQVRKNAATILVSTPDLLQIIPEATYVPVFLDFGHFIYQKSEKSSTAKGVVSILHSPSATKTKGSGHLNKIFENLKKEFGESIEFITPAMNLNEIKSYPTTRYDLLNRMSESNIVIDQLVIGWYGLKAVEALMLECEVICFIEDKQLDHLPADAPLINSNVLNIESKLRELIQQILSGNPVKSDKGDYVKDYHNIQLYRDYFKKIWLQPETF
jgi:hypothetical protein